MFAANTVRAINMYLFIVVAGKQCQKLQVLPQAELLSQSGTHPIQQTYHSNIRSLDPMFTGNQEKVRTSAVVPIKHNTCMYTIIKNGHRKCKF